MARVVEAMNDLDELRIDFSHHSHDDYPGDQPKLEKILSQHALVGLTKGIGLSVAACKVILKNESLCDYNMIHYLSH